MKESLPENTGDSSVEKKDPLWEKIDEVLVGVMLRYRNFFLGPGINMDEYSVPLRSRPDFVAPLVTVMGYTFGLKSLKDEGDYFIEVSGNVYASGFNIDRFRGRIKEELSPQVATEIMQNFADDADYTHVKKRNLYELADYFEFSPDEDIRIATKKKKEESKVTKKMEDVILQQRFRVKKKQYPAIQKSPDAFGSAVYLYCLRLFVSAYRKSL
ncbi:MAG TPA: hypothetical protein VFG11_07865 [Acidobacteriota bacterium]|nr:hypothetical protein [Acidobacteriota bacterium]